MRNILFRGKRVDNEEWVYGFYVKKEVGEFVLRAYKKKIIDVIILNFSDGGITYIEVIPETVGQYTGLTDKNGTKIFEGDRFEYGYVATWVDESSNGSHGMFAGWYLQRDDFESWEELSVGYSYEVIGNIHEKGK